MKLPVLFAYLTESHQRRHGPSGYLNYSDFKPWLRDEFVFRCVYCLEREQWYPDRFASFSVDHVIPQSKNKNLVNVYENLVYACTRCNSARQDVTLLDPTKQALGNHLKLGEEGMLEGLTEEGLRLIERLQLNENPALKNRQFYLKLVEVKQASPDDPKVEELFREAFKYPDDLPDLRRLRPPEGNKHKKNAATCYFARQEKGELDPIY